MQQITDSLMVKAERQGLHEITSSIARWILSQSITDGLLTLFIRHSSASLLIQENAAPAAKADLERWLAKLAPESDHYEHDDEGPDDMPAHLRAAITQTHLSIPVAGRAMLLGTWQGIYLFEHRRRPSPREIVVHLVGTP